MITATFKRLFKTQEELDLYCIVTFQSPMSVEYDSSDTEDHELLEGGYAPVKEKPDEC